MVRFLGWCRSIVMSVVNGIARAVLVLILLLVALLVFSLAWGDGQPKNMVLALDLREPIADSAASPGTIFTPRRVTVMEIVLGMETAGRDKRVKGMVMRLGNGALSIAEGQEIAGAIQRFKAKDKFVIAQTTAFFGAGLGDYVAASAANEIWMQPKSPFTPSGTGGGGLYLRGVFDKIEAEPQIVKRAEYKSAADMFMEKQMSAADREQLTRLMQSVYDSAVTQMAAARKLAKPKIVAALEASPQFSEDALKARLIDRIGYDDEAAAAANARAGAGAKTVKFMSYARDAAKPLGAANIAIVEAAGEIRDGTAKDSLLGANAGIASDDLSQAIRQAARDKAIKAIVLRVDSPGGSVTASDQILHAVKAAQKAGKPVVVSMGGVVASGGYFISVTANRIVAQPGTITGSIGVLTGKISFNKTLGLVGANSEQVSVGRNTLMGSPLSPYTPEQLVILNRQADVIYDDFTAKVAAGRKLPLDKVRAVARGRVWSGTDAQTHGLVDRLGGFWTAAGEAAALAKVPAGEMAFKIYPRRTGLWGSLSRLMGGMDASFGLLGRIESLLYLPALQALLGGISELPAGGPGGGVSLKAAQLPEP
ncbi:MAG: signal peptide peptidase SppA, type [Pseudomonadota bacterium]|jgi:protease-4